MGSLTARALALAHTSARHVSPRAGSGGRRDTGLPGQRARGSQAPRWAVEPYLTPHVIDLDNDEAPADVELRVVRDEPGPDEPGSV